MVHPDNNDYSINLNRRVHTNWTLIRAYHFLFAGWSLELFSERRTLPAGSVVRAFHRNRGGANFVYNDAQNFSSSRPQGFQCQYRESAKLFRAVIRSQKGTGFQPEAETSINYENGGVLWEEYFFSAS